MHQEETFQVDKSLDCPGLKPHEPIKSQVFQAGEKSLVRRASLEAMFLDCDLK